MSSGLDLDRVLRLARSRLRRRALGTVAGGFAVAVLFGLAGEGVRAVVHDDDPVPTTTPSATTTEPPAGLGTPTLTAEATGPRTVRLEWREPAGRPTRYVVYRDGRVVEVVTARRFVDTGRVPGRAYAYAVAARDRAGNESPRSGVVEVTMPRVPPPSKLAAEAMPGLVTLTWEPSPDDGVVAYRVLRDGVQLGEQAADTRSYRDRNVRQLRTYEYEVVAVDGEGHASEPASVRATAADTQAPTMPTAVDVTVRSGATEVEWTASTDNVGVARYEIRREGKVVGTVDGGTTTFVEDGNQYYQDYTVVAIDAAGNRSRPSAAAEESPQVD